MKIDLNVKCTRQPALNAERNVRFHFYPILRVLCFVQHAGLKNEEKESILQATNIVGKIAKVKPFLTKKPRLNE